jgi:AraC-like DNA-binding protein
VALRARSDTRGIVDPAAGFEHFTLTRHAPASDLAWAVDRYWIVTWDLRGKESYDQRVVPHPAVHLVFEAGAANIEAISADEFVRRLEGRGQVLGVKFQPAGFRPYLGGPVGAIAGERLPAAGVLGSKVDDVAALIEQADDLETMIPAVEGLIRSFGVGPLPMTEAVNDIVASIANDRSITRVDYLAAQLKTTTRRLQRLFADHVGLGPKWVINRFRVHEAADAAITGPQVDWARLAIDLGYSDQSHLVREFTAAVGTSPDRYARLTGQRRRP